MYAPLLMHTKNNSNCFLALGYDFLWVMSTNSLKFAQPEYYRLCIMHDVALCIKDDICTYMHACIQKSNTHLAFLSVIFHGKRQPIYFINIFMQNAMYKVKYIIA